MPHIVIDGINNRPRAPEPIHGFWQSLAAGVSLVVFAAGVLAWAAS